MSTVSERDASTSKAQHGHRRLRLAMPVRDDTAVCVGLGTIVSWQRRNHPTLAASSPGCLPVEGWCGRARFYGHEPRGSERRRAYRFRYECVLVVPPTPEHIPDAFFYISGFQTSQLKIAAVTKKPFPLYCLVRSFLFLLLYLRPVGFIYFGSNIAPKRCHFLLAASAAETAMRSAIAIRRCASRTCRSSIMRPSTTMTALSSACASS